MTKKEIDYNLINKIQNGDNEAFNELVKNNINLVHKIAQPYKFKQNCEYDDIVQVGLLGFVEAVNRFDLSLGNSLSTFVVPYIHGHILRYIKEFNTVKMPRSTLDKLVQIQKLLSDNSEISEIEICESLQISQYEFNNMQNARKISSLDACGDAEDKCDSFVNYLEDKFCLEDFVSNKEYFKSEIDKLKPKERQVVIMRYYNNLTQVEVSEFIGMSQSQVSKLEKNALSKLKRGLTL